MTDKFENPDAGDSDTWESAEIKVKRPSTGVISVRMPAELLISLESYGHARNLSISDVVRRAAESLVTGEQRPRFALEATAGAPSFRVTGPTLSITEVTNAPKPRMEERFGYSASPTVTGQIPKTA